MSKEHLFNCPNCGVSWVDRPIPDEQLEVFSGKFFLRIIGMYSLAQDRTVAYMCPDCKKEFPREEVDELKILCEI